VRSGAALLHSLFRAVSRDLKRNQAVLPKIAMWLIAMRCIDLYWLTRPEFTSMRCLRCWIWLHWRPGRLGYGFRLPVEAAAVAVGRTETRRGYRES
jgi:hypothetical protein